MTSLDLSKHGIHGPNVRIADFRPTVDAPHDDPAACWTRVAVSQARWIKLLWPDHSRADAAAAKARGLRVLMRAPGEGIVHVDTVRTMIAALAGVVDTIEVGNEPYLTDAYPTWDGLWWNHAWYLDTIWTECRAAAHAAGIQLCTPGWRAELDPPDVRTDLGRRLHDVYARYDAVAVHSYDPFTLTVPGVTDRITRWRKAFDGRPVYLTEYGIAARILPGCPDQAASDREKARRYAAFVRLLSTQSWLTAMFAFLVGGTPQWEAFNDGPYVPNGQNRYTLSTDAWAVLGASLT